MQNIKSGKISISSSNLKVGDIILTTAKHIFSSVIRAATKSDISHAMVYVGNDEIIHSNGSGVHSLHISDVTVPVGKSFYIRRLPVEMSIEEQVYLSVFLRGKIGYEYDIAEAIKSSGISHGRKPGDFSRKQFCSRLVAQAYESIGWRIVKDPNFCSPQELKISKDLVEVAPIVAKYDCASIFKDKIDRFRSVELKSLKKLREVCGNELQGLDDMAYCIIKNRDKQAEIISGLEKTGFFRLSSYFDESNSWQWDAMDLTKCNLPKEIIREFFLKSGDQDSLLYQIYSKRNISTYIAMKDIYSKEGESDLLKPLKRVGDLQGNIAHILMESRLLFDSYIHNKNLIMARDDSEIKKWAMFMSNESCGLSDLDL